MGRSVPEDRPLILKAGLHFLDEVDSTNSVAMERARAGAPHGWAVVAQRQTNGRGRLGRKWEEGEGNLYFSVVLRPKVKADQLAWLTLGAGVVLAEILGAPFLLKWPNDLLDDENLKVAGILAEAEWSGGNLQAVIIGIGVNLVRAPASMPATHLGAHGIDWSCAALAERLRGELMKLDLSTVSKRWKARSCTLGRRIRVGDIEGVAIDLDHDGALLVQTASGVRRVVTGDVGFVSGSLVD